MFFRKKNQPEAIKGDMIGEALVEVRERIEKIGWNVGGGFDGENDPMCLGNHVAVVASKREKMQFPFHILTPWTQLRTSNFGTQLVGALGFPHVDPLWMWNDSLYSLISKRRGRRAVLRRVNDAIERRNAYVISKAEVAKARKEADASYAEQQKLYVPSEWEPRTVSGEHREKVAT